MKNDASINDQHYWDERFRTDWEAMHGPEQSRFFSKLALEHLPAWIFHLARRDGLTVADWGCAQGDGTELLASALGTGIVTGIDFSPQAIAQAQARYPGLRFLAVDWLAEKAPAQTFDLVFSSNTLEHFAQPLPVLDTIARRASKAVLLALPYRELDRHAEHFFTFLPQNIPAVLGNGFRLAWSRVVDCRSLPGSLWNGDQVFLVYVDPAWADASLALTLDDCRIESGPAAEQAAAWEGLRTELANSRTELDASRAELAQRGNELQLLTRALDERAQQAAELQRQVEQRTAETHRLQATMVEMQRQVDALQRDLNARTGELQTRDAELAANAQELRRISAWASQIASHPGTYAIKRNSYLLAQQVYRHFPMSLEGKQKLRNLAYRVVRPRGAAAAPALVTSQSTAAQALAKRNIRLHEGERDVFVFAVIDWHFRIQRPQHLARSLAEGGRRVFFISNVFVDAAEPGYALERLDPALDLYQVKLHVPGAPQIYFARADAATLRMLQASMAALMADFGALSSVSVVQHAFWYPLVKTLPNSVRVYDCMDHHEGFGNVPQELIAAEQEMLGRSDLVVTTSSWLQEFASGHNRNVVVVRNAVEYAFFSQAPATVYRDEQGRRIIGYFGAIAEWFDIALVRRVAQAHPDCLVLLVGNDTVRAASQLKDVPNVKFTGEVPYRELPHYLYAFDVCLLPFQVSPLTLATNPVKVYEYLAAGKPVVCVDLPEVAQFGDLVAKGSDAADFVAQVTAALAENDPARAQARRAFAAQQTWSHRGQQLRAALDAVRLPKVSVIVLTYNNLELTQACLASLVRESDYPDLEIILVDNASSDGSPEYLRQFAQEHPGTKLILNDTNLGFAAGNNVGLAAATGDYLVVLNNDTVVTRGWVMTLMRHLQQDQDIGLIGPLTNNIGNAARIAMGYQQIADMPSEAFGVTLAHMGAAFPLRTAAFFCVMLPRAVYERCGPMCEDYGRGFFEDDDYCRRVEREGLRVMCAEDVFVHHHLSASFAKVPSAERQALFEQNRVTYEAKWGPWEPHTYSREHVTPAGAPVTSTPVPAPSPAPAPVAAPSQFAGQQFVAGHCAVCGHTGRFFYTDKLLWRESLNCEHCLSTSRYRSVARGILRAIRDITGIEADSLATLPKNQPRRLSMYDTQPPFYYLPCAYPLPDLLKQTGWFDVALSQYKPDLPPGKKISAGVTNQNLERLTYETGSLDILVTSDVMEHVRLDRDAHREIHRVLRVGGAYVFTVPHDLAMEQTIVRVAIHDPQDPSRDELLMEPEYHGDTNGDGSGVLAYRLYGRDLLESLEELGFEVDYVKVDRPEEGILNTELFYCRKVRG